MITHFPYHLTHASYFYNMNAETTYAADPIQLKTGNNHIMYHAVQQSVHNNTSYVPDPNVNDNISVLDEQPQQPPVEQFRQLLPEGIHTLLNPQLIYSRIAEQMSGSSFSGVDPEVFVKLSDLVESRLRDLLKQLSSIAEHRLEPLRLNPLYTQTNEPRKQLRFIDDIDKLAYTRRQNIEKEAWLKYSKSKTKDKDTVQKAKEIQKANQEENLNREANEAAIAALGGGRGPKRTAGGEVVKSSTITTQGLQAHRPRVRRVIMKDFLCALNGKGVQRNSVFKFLVAYGLVEMSEKSSADIN